MTWRLLLALIGLYLVARLLLGAVDPSTMSAAHHATMQLVHGATRR